MIETVRTRTVDLETTDFPPNADVIEAGFVDTLICREVQEDASLPHNDWQIERAVDFTAEKLFKPDRTISNQARATHHIDPKTLVDADHHSMMNGWVTQSFPSAPTLYVAHNADFEKQFITIPDGCYWIDTYKVSLRVNQDFDGHSNQFLRYQLGLEVGEEGMPPHRALPDCHTTTQIFCHFVRQGIQVRDMIKWTGEPQYLTKLTFGKHYGMRYEEVPTSYLNWILSQHDMEEGVKAAARRVLYGEK